MDILSEVTLKAANFFAGFLKSTVDRQKRGQFVLCLKKQLISRIETHWYPDNPTRGQAYRCIRLNSHSKEPIINEALIETGLTKDLITLPLELTVWIDPNEVCYRFGEDEGSVCPLFTVHKDSASPSKTYKTECMNPLAADFIPQSKYQVLLQQPRSPPLDPLAAVFIPQPVTSFRKRADHTRSRKRRYRSKKSKIPKFPLPYPDPAFSGYIKCY